MGDQDQWARWQVILGAIGVVLALGSFILSFYGIFQPEPNSDQYNITNLSESPYTSQIHTQLFENTPTESSDSFEAFAQINGVNRSYFQQGEYESDAWKNQNYTFIQLFGKYYVPFGSPPNITLVELLLDTGDKIDLEVGSAIVLGNGYCINFKTIDYDFQTAWVQVEKDGEVFCDDCLLAGKTYNFKDEILGEDNIVLRVNSNPVIKGENVSFIQVNGLWLVDFENAFTVKPGDELDGYKIMEINNKYISYKSLD